MGTWALGRSGGDSGVGRYFVLCAAAMRACTVCMHVHMRNGKERGRPLRGHSGACCACLPRAQAVGMRMGARQREGAGKTEAWARVACCARAPHPQVVRVRMCACAMGAGGGNRGVPYVATVAQWHCSIN
eukprot:6177539-Pleurochrysis_carterae.AAC.4